MRWFTINSLLLAVVITSAESRPKRHIGFLKNLLASFLGRTEDVQSTISLDTEPEYNLFTVPALGNQVFEMPITKELKSEIVLADEAPIVVTETLPIVTSEKVYVVPNPSDSSEYKVKVPFEVNYSYTTLKNNEPVMTYTARYNPELIIRKGTALPWCIKRRIGEVLFIGAYPYSVESSRNSTVDVKYTPSTRDEPRLPDMPTVHTTEPNESITKKTLASPADSTPEILDKHVHGVMNLKSIDADKTKGDFIPYMPHISTAAPNYNVKTNSKSVPPIAIDAVGKEANYQTVPSHAFTLLNPKSSDLPVANPSGTGNIMNDKLSALSDYNVSLKANNRFSLPVNTVSTQRPIHEGNSFNDNPIVVPDFDQSFLYNRIKFESVSLNKGAQNRGDIPDLIM